MIVAWGLSRDLTADGATSSLRELAVRAKADDFDTAGLAAAWSLEEVLFTPEAMEFIDEYWLRRDGFEVDVGNLATANRLDDRSANYRRFAAILDGRFATWKARASSTGGG